MAGIRQACNRPKTAKRLRAATTKKFRNESAEALGRYKEKIAARRQRKLKRRRRA